MERFNAPWLHSDFMFKHSPTGKEFYKHLKVLHDFTGGVVKERRGKRVEEEKQSGRDDDVGMKKKKAFLDLLLDECDNQESSNKLTDEDIREEVDTFMFEV